MRKNLKKEVRSCVDKIGPQMFKNFDKMKLIMMKGSQGSRDDTPTQSKTDYDISYLDEMEIT